MSATHHSEREPGHGGKNFASVDGSLSSPGLILAWYGFAVLFSTVLLGLIVRQMLPLITPSLKASLGFTDFQIGSLMGLGLAVFATVASYPMGWLADRFGRRLILAIGVGAWSVATAFFAFQDSFGGLFVGTMGIAIGEAALLPIAYALIPDLIPERQRQTANFIFYGGLNLGGGIAMAAGGVMLEWLGGSRVGIPSALANIDSWRLAMAAVALPGPLFFLLVITMPGGRGRAPIVSRQMGVDAAMHDFVPYARGNWRTLVCIFGSAFAMAVAINATVSWFPLALPRAFGINPASVGVGLGTAVMIATLVGMVLPPAVLKLRKRTDDIAPVEAAGIFLALAALPAAALPFAGTPFQAYAAAAFLGAMGVAGSALMPGLLQNLAPPQLRSRVIAILGIVNALALAVSPIAIGYISDLLPGPHGTLRAIGLVAVPALVAAATLMWLAPRPYAATLRAIRSKTSGEIS
jgi:MFS family permease